MVDYLAFDNIALNEWRSTGYSCIYLYIISDMIIRYMIKGQQFIVR